MKTDLEDKRAVQLDEAGAWCRENGNIPHFSVSAKTGENVEQAFIILAAQAKRKIEARRINAPS
jgi:hypothetical protein